MEALEIRQLLSISNELVADLQTHDPRGPYVLEIAAGDNQGFFTADTPATGHELWRTDGTTAGTRLVRDILPGPTSSYPRSLKAVANDVYFVAPQWVYGEWYSSHSVLWRSDGTEGGTQIVTWADGSPIVDPAGLEELEGSLLFWATLQGEERTRLYRIENTPEAEPEPITLLQGNMNHSDIKSVTGSGIAAYLIGTSFSPRVVTVQADQPSAVVLGQWNQIGTHLAAGQWFYFYGTPSYLGPVEHVLTRGTTATTIRLPLPFDSSVSAMSEMPTGELLLVTEGSKPNRVRTLWTTDGTAAGTRELFDLPGQGLDYTPSHPVVVGLPDGHIAFFANGAVWQTDGTTTGTVRLTDPDRVSIFLSHLIPFRNQVMFTGREANPPGYQDSLYLAGGPTANLTNLGPIDEDFGRSQFFATFDSGSSLMLYHGRKENGDDGLWSSNGNHSLLSIGPGLSSNGRSNVTVAAVGKETLFVRHSWNDFTELNNNGEIRTAHQFENAESIHATNSEMTWALTRSDILLRRTNNSNPVSLGSLIPSLHNVAPSFVAATDSRLFFMNRLPSGERTLWVTDSTVEGTHPIESSSGRFTWVADALVIENQRMIFRAPISGGGGTVWVTDGTSTGTFLIPELSSFFVTPDSAHVSRVFGQKYSTDLWVTDGTVDGTIQIFSDGQAHLGITATTATHAFFHRFSHEFGTSELYWSDGTVEGTQKVSDRKAIMAETPLAIGDQLFWVADDGVWAAGGATRIERKLLDVPMTQGPFGRAVELFSLFGQLYFFADTNAHGRALWISDGTTEGTRVLLDANGKPIHPAYEPPIGLGGSPMQLVAAHGQIFYPGIFDPHDVELMTIKSDTVEGVPSSLRITPGPAPRLHWTEVFGAASYEVRILSRLPLKIEPPRPIVLLNSDTATPHSSLNGQGSLLPQDSRLYLGEIKSAESNWFDLPQLDPQFEYTVEVRGVAANGTRGDWSTERLSFTVGDRPLWHSTPLPSTNPTPVLSWVMPAGATESEIWINDLDRKERVGIRRVSGTTGEFQCPTLRPSLYVAWVRTRDINGWSDWSQAETFTVLVHAPQSVTATVDANSRVTVSWTPVNGATDYLISIPVQERIGWVIRKSQIGPVTSWTFAEPLAPGIYTVTVQARRNGRFHSDPSQPNPLIVRQPPVVQVALPEFRWQWVDGAIGFEATARDPRTGAAIPGLLDTSRTMGVFRLSNPVPYGPVELRVRSTYFDGVASEWITVRTEVFHPAVQFTSTNIETVDATPVLAWQPQAGASGYDVVISPDSSNAVTYRAAIGATGQHRIPSPLNPGAYRVWVRSKYVDGSRGLWGEGTTLKIGTPPVATASGDRALSWLASNGATRYEVVLHRIVPTNSASQLVHRVLVHETHYVLPAIPPGKYRFWVRAIRDEAGDQYQSRWSTAIDVVV